MASYTSDDLLRGVRRLGFLPDASDLTDTDLLEFADEEQVTLISASIKTEREEHYVVYQDYVLTSAKVYPMPARAMGRMVRGITLITPAGISFACPAIDPVNGWNGIPSTSNTSYCHFITADQINFPSIPPAGWTMRVWYLRRPSGLILTSAAAAITSAPTATTIAVASNYSWILKGYLLDIVRGQVPFEASYVDLLVTADAVTTTIALSGTTPVDPALVAAPIANSNQRQDWLCPAGKTVFPQVAAEFFPALEAAVCRRALESLGDRIGAQLVTDTYAKRSQAAVDITSPREETGGRAIVRRSSPLRSGGWGGWGRRGFR